MNPAVANGFFLTLKGAASAALAVLVCQRLGVEDLLSATFVAVISASPTVTAGLRGAAQQLLLSLLAGATSALWALVPMPLPVRVLGAVASSVALSYPLRMAASYGTAAFCALYVQLVPGAPTQTLLMRLASVAVGVACAFLVNALVTWPFYGQVFRKRLQRLHKSLGAALQAGAGADALWTWEVAARHVVTELNDALTERWRPGVPTDELIAIRGTLEGWLQRVVKLRGADVGSSERMAADLRRALD